MKKRTFLTCSFALLLTAVLPAYVSAQAPVIDSVASKYAKRINLVVDNEKNTIYVPVKYGTNLKKFAPEFISSQGGKVTPVKPQNFTKGDVKYTVSLPGAGEKTYSVSARVDNNPVLDGYYADPEVLYSHKTGKYYIYPTSDGYYEWSGWYFKVFSSDDLVNWKDEGVILDLKKDVSWCNGNAWAPAIIEKKSGDGYKYYYYFSAEKKIGVAVADHPTGPFRDSGKALIDFRPEGASRGQEIDPDVYTDPKTGKSYLYWGSGYLAVAELNEDMISIDKSTIKVITPRSTFREGAYVFDRNGVYYFLWSENDTRDENYRVRYATSDSPTGPLNIPENNLILAKDPSQGIYGPGHNSVLQIPGRDEWYIVYHRFNLPKGINMGRSAGYNREVCIDRLEFNPDGTIKPATPTLNGIAPLKKGLK